MWDAAIHNPFLKALKDGSITKEQFDTWLIQDYSFVEDFTRWLDVVGQSLGGRHALSPGSPACRLVARALSQAPFQAFDVLLGGLTALQAELSWFQASQYLAQTLPWLARH